MWLLYDWIMISGNDSNEPSKNPETLAKASTTKKSLSLGLFISKAIPNRKSPKPIGSPILIIRPRIILVQRLVVLCLQQSDMHIENVPRQSASIGAKRKNTDK
ncbi:unnamed protein product [Blepharisma stoltei]|uniref:Uncharacterized protein n=1 Tax=Blepharisma stoltei TaxID=1481888 RepID=A0AAU9IEF9_9CILI|nr:unnamed protein product [Blepharisma stoltei]